MKSHAVPLHPAQDVNYPFVQGIHAVSHLVVVLVITVTVSQCLWSRDPSFT